MTRIILKRFTSAGGPGLFSNALHLLVNGKSTGEKGSE